MRHRPAERTDTLVGQADDCAVATTVRHCPLFLTTARNHVGGLSILLLLFVRLVNIVTLTTLFALHNAVRCPLINPLEWTP